ncbi:MAG: hypothetical protein U0746_04715 [Gemmataceae bacterium]
MAARSQSNDRYKKQKAKRLRRHALQLAQVNAGRACGGCTACCTVMGVAEIPTPFFTRCPHETDAGCAIYDKRPGACRDFYCEWLVGGFGEADRPDKLGLLFVPTRYADAGVVHECLVAYEVWPSAADSEAARTILASASVRGEVGLIRHRDLSTCRLLGSNRVVVPHVTAAVMPR